MTSARLTISTASDRLRALRFNSRLSGGAKTTLPKLIPPMYNMVHNESLTYCTRSMPAASGTGSWRGLPARGLGFVFSCFFIVWLALGNEAALAQARKIETFSQTGSSKTPKCFLATNEKIAATDSML